ncbi:MAG: DUF3181 family protein [Pseudanabaenaceae cyanobacterium bins.68]|nr:DUF3181 family protein [Pseudanabaenaceae cyanobacterium bins.68]
MNNQIEIERLAVAIAEDIYLDVAKWHLYLDDAKIHLDLAAQFLPLLQQGQITAAQVQAVLAKIPIAIGNGKHNLPLDQFIPASGAAQLLEILNEFELTA